MIGLCSIAKPSCSSITYVCYADQEPVNRGAVHCTSRAGDKRTPHLARSVLQIISGYMFLHKPRSGLASTQHSDRRQNSAVPAATRTQLATAAARGQATRLASWKRGENRPIRTNSGGSEWGRVRDFSDCSPITARNVSEFKRVQVDGGGEPPYKQCGVEEAVLG